MRRPCVCVYVELRLGCRRADIKRVNEGTERRPHAANANETHARDGDVGMEGETERGRAG